MYYITSPSSSGEFALLDISESRTNARAFAKDVGGTVRTQDEFDMLVGTFGVPKLSKALSKNPKLFFLVNGGFDKEDHAAAVQLQSIAAPTAVPGAVLDTAKAIKSTRKSPKTVGAKLVPAGKRIYTKESVIKEATAAYAKAFDNIGSKVKHVRWVAGWASAQGVRLQRRDAFVVLAETDVAAATINTQWQLVRSGKL